MRHRYLSRGVEELCLADGKIAFVSGPRQAGKTTLAKQMLAERGSGAYYNWDQAEFRRLWAATPQRVAEQRAAPGAARVPLVVLDEIHKARLWKRTLKGIYDTLTSRVDFIVTGSARLAIYRRGSDSLLGRHRAFRLHPFSLGELLRREAPGPDTALAALEAAVSTTRSAASRRSTDTLVQMLTYGPFPEPFLAQDARKARLWRRGRVEAVIREDLRDLTRIPELDRVEMLAALLPERVASPLSVTALREVLEVSHDTITRWLLWLKELYYAFEVKPHTANVARSLRKEGKLYLWDYGEVQEPGPRFENLVAAHLLKACHYWTDTGAGAFDLRYLRNKERKEIDFLVTRDGAPWLAVEAKLTDTALAPGWAPFLRTLPCKLALQLVATPGVRREHTVGVQRVVVLSADRALACLP